MILLDCSTTSKESNKEDDASNNNEKDRGGKELVTKKVKILTVDSLDNPTSNDEEETR